MADNPILSTPGPNPADLIAASKIAASKKKLSTATHAKAKSAAQDFEAVFLNTMFQQMFTGIDGEGPFGGQGSSGVWRAMLTDQYSRNFAQAGGIGISDQVYRALIEQQAARQ